MNVCFDCYSHGHRCSGPNHELHLTFHDQNTDQQYTQSLDHTRDLLAMEAGCSDSVDPLLDLAKPSSMPKDWFRCLCFLPTSNEFELLECVLVDEEYPRTKLDDLAVVHTPKLPPGEATHAILCNNELVEVPQLLYGLLNGLKQANSMRKGMGQVSFERFWIAELCLAEPLRSSPPIPLEAICALAGCVTDNHVFFEAASPQPDSLSDPPVVKLVRLVKFDRLGTPVLHCRDVRPVGKSNFHLRMLSTEQNTARGTVFVNGLARDASQDVISFLRTCTCETNPSEVPAEYSAALQLQLDDPKRKVAPDCPIHGDAVEFLIPELCLPAADAIERSGEHSIWNWIRENASTEKEPDARRLAAYAPLHAGQIRLLHFFPLRLGRKGNLDAPMATITHKLGQTPKFAALSYCWGSSTRDCLLPMLTGEIVKITEHLGQIVRELVQCGITDVWIDQICIDQDNLEEKSIQVAQMLHIYKAADEVLIHLGPLSAPEKVARFVRDVAPRCLQQGLPSTNLSPEDLACWFAFIKARKSSWFSRTWIVQEMSVNPKTSVLLGLERVPWDDFLAADSLTNTELFYSSIPPDIVAMHSIPVFAKIRRQQQQRGGYDAVDLFEILVFTRFLNASEPKDKIFAFLGLFDPTSIGKWLPFPNYRRHVADVYTSFAAAYALNGYVLPLLQLAGTSQTSRDHQSLLPSWVPDWSFGNVLFRSLRQNRAFEHGSQTFSSGFGFEGSAALRSLPVAAIAEAVPHHGFGVAWRRNSIGDFSNRNQGRDERQSMTDAILLPIMDHYKASNSETQASILVKTALFDEVIGLTKIRLYEELLRTHIHGQELQTPSEALLELNKEAIELVSAHIKAEDRGYRLAKTMIADTWRDKDSTDMAEVHSQWLRGLDEVKEGMLPEVLGTNSPVHKYVGRVRQTLHNRMFGVTKGCRMGIFPSTSQIGDRVGIVAGLDLPCVFSKCANERPSQRPVERSEEFSERFAFVGEAYVEGVMYGEFEETKEAKFRDLEIV